MRSEVWRKYNGNDKNNGICQSCKRPVDYDDFVCGHIIAHKHGGSADLNNLKPICVRCNGSMVTRNMDDFTRDLAQISGGESKKPVLPAAAHEDRLLAIEKNIQKIQEHAASNDMIVNDLCGMISAMALDTSRFADVPEYRSARLLRYLEEKDEKFARLLKVNKAVFTEMTATWRALYDNMFHKNFKGVYHHILNHLSDIDVEVICFTKLTGEGPIVGYKTLHMAPFKRHYTAAQDEDHVHEIFMIEHAGNFERAIGMANSMRFICAYSQVDNVYKSD